MKFFIPGVRGKTIEPEQADQIYQAIAGYNGMPTNVPMNARVYSVTWVLGGKDYRVAVGDPAPEFFGADAGTVLALFDTEKGCLICTTNRGGANGPPVLVGSHFNPQLTYFEA